MTFLAPATTSCLTRTPGALAVVAHQSDPRPPQDRLRFCVNLEVFLPRLIDDRRRGLPPGRLVRREDPHWCERLTPEPELSDYWWTADLGDAAAVAELFAWHEAQVHEAIVPRLRVLGSEEAVKQRWAAGDAGWLGIAQRDEYLGVLERLKE